MTVISCLTAATTHVSGVSFQMQLEMTCSTELMGCDAGIATMLDRHTLGFSQCNFPTNSKLERAQQLGMQKLRVKFVIWNITQQMASL